HAFLWQNGKMTALATLARGYTTSQAVALNARGQVVGTSHKPYVTQTGQPGTAFLWQRGKMTSLGMLAGDRSSSAVAINDRGHVAGSSEDGRGGFHPVLWRDGKKIALATFGSGYSEPAAIDSRGRVIGSSVPAKGGTVHA